MVTAREKGVAGFLDNPQCLNMLADVVTAGEGWPGSRLELFEQACRRMVRVHNEEHIAAVERSARSTAIQEDDLLDAAGRLCAVLLISGSAGCATTPRREDADYPDLKRCATEYREPCRRAVSTKLFTAAAEGRFRPVHRHAAEFLAGRYLARLIAGDGQDGRGVRNAIPARRIVALIAGHDGGVVTELRGLSAWLAAHGRSARNEFIERDPIGVGLYGDIGEFSPREKRDLVASLERAASRLHLASGATAAFESLATSAMEPVIEGILRDTGREPEHQSFVGFVLGVLRHGSRLPGLTQALLTLVYDGKWSSHVNVLALRAFLHNCPDGAEKTNSLKQLLADVRARTIPDPHEELKGILLSKLYPRDVSPPDVWRYLAATEDLAVLGSSWRFWSTQIPDESSDDEVVALLDSLQRRFCDLRPALQTREDARETPTKLLARALDVRGDAIDIRRLHDWLSVGGVGSRDGLRECYKSVRDIRQWLEDRPEVQKAVLLEGLSRCTASDDFWRQAFDVRNFLYGARRPPDYGIWCLMQAVFLADTRLKAAEYLLLEAFQAHKDRDGNEGLSLDVIEAQVGKNEKLKPGWDWVQHSSSSPADTEERNRYAEEQQKREEEPLAQVRSNLEALHENRAAPALLFRMGARVLRELRGISRGRRTEERRETASKGPSLCLAGRGEDLRLKTAGLVRPCRQAGYGRGSGRAPA